MTEPQEIRARALDMLNDEKARLNRTQGGFLGQVAVSPFDMSPGQRAFFDKLCRKTGREPVFGGDAS